MRNIAHVSVGGRRVRVRVSNAFGDMPLRARRGACRLQPRRCVNQRNHRPAAHVRRATLHPGSGACRGGQRCRGPVRGIGLRSCGELCLPAVTEPATFNEFKIPASYVTAVNSGNLVNAADLPTAEPVRQVFYTTVVEVQPTESVGALVTLGDSITQGGGSTDQNLTWPDRVAARFNPNRPRLAVVNQGVGCHPVGHCADLPRSRASIATCSRRRRVARDHRARHQRHHDSDQPAGIRQAGVRPADSRPRRTSSAACTSSRSARAARASRVYGATITPFGSSTVPVCSRRKTKRSARP